MAALRSTLFVLSAMVMAPTLAAGASSDWFQTQGGRVRLVVLPEEADGRIPALLDVRLEPGWKTYWRDPGQSGIPPSISIPPTSGLALETMRFPVPKQFDDGYSHYAGYDRSVAFPLTLRRTVPDAAAHNVSASVFLGICKDICIPVQADLSVKLDADATSGADEAAVRAAAATLPEGPSSGFAAKNAEWSADKKRLTVTFSAPEPTPDKPLQVFVSGPDGFQFGSSAVPLRVGDAYRVEIPLLHKPKSASLSGAPILLTVESGGRSMETPLAID